MALNEVLTTLPSGIVIVSNPANEIYAEVFGKRWFEPVHRVRATDEVLDIVGRYRFLKLPRWWRGNPTEVPKFATRAIFSRDFRTFFEDTAPISPEDNLLRATHETGHGVIRDLSSPQNSYPAIFTEGLAEMLANAVLEHSRKIPGNRNWNELSLRRKFARAEKLEREGCVPARVREIFDQYVFGHHAVYEVMKQVFDGRTPLLDQVEFIIRNYDPAIIGSDSERESYVEYARELRVIEKEEQEEAIA